MERNETTQGRRFPKDVSHDPQSGIGSTATHTKDRAVDVAHDAQGEAGIVVHEAAEQVKAVAHEATAGVRDVVDEARRVVHDEADKQTHAVSTSVRRLAADLEEMSGTGRHDTPAADYVGRIGRALESVADRLDDGGIDGALDSVREVARRHPGMFLTGAALGGFSLARVLRHADVRAANGEQGSPQGQLTPYGESQLRGAAHDDEVLDLRGDDRRAPVGAAPQLRDDMQEWVRP